MTITVSEDQTLRTGLSLPTRYGALCVALIALASCAPPEEPPGPGAGLRLTEVGYDALQGWDEGGQGAALTAFRRSCERIAEMPESETMTGAGYGGTASDWRAVCEAASQVPPDDDAARAFFEAAFAAYRAASDENDEGLFTGYYEPELNGSRTRQGAFQTPLYGVPGDLVSIDLGLFRENLAGQRLAGRVEDNRLVPYATRAEITRDGLDAAEPLLFVDSPADAFFLQIQGSGRVRLDDGTVVRAAYAGQNGHPYTAIGAVLIRRGELTRENVSTQSIRAWLEAHPDDAQDLFDQNASYVFFSLQPLDDPALGAVGTQGAPLTAQASLAVDAQLHPLGAPIWLDTTVPVSAEIDVPFRRLLIAQDTGGAINGAVRGDIYWGVGDEAGEIAGRMRSTGTMTVLVPRIIAERIGDSYAPEANAQ